MTLTTWFETQIADEATQGVSIENRSFYLRQDKPAFTAVLIVHGFSANPNDGRTVADRIFREGDCDVLGICLPGHGAHPQAMEGCEYTDWLGAVQSAYDQLREHYQQVVIYAISMGALLALNVAIKHPPAGLICMGTMMQAVDWRLKFAGVAGKVAIGIWRHILRQPYVGQEVLPGREHIVYDRFPVEAPVELTKLMAATRRILAKVDCPLLIIHSQTDQIADPKGANHLYDNVATPNKAILWGEGDHTFLTEFTDANITFFDAIARFCTSPVGYFSAINTPGKEK